MGRVDQADQVGRADRADRSGGGATPVTDGAGSRVPGRRTARWARTGSAWTRGRVLAAVAALTALLLAFPRVLPNRPGHLGSLLEAFLPWLGLAVVPLLVLALLRRSFTALLALLLPVAAWAYAFGGLFLAGPGPAEGDLVVVQHNVSDVNTDPAGTARTLAAAGPDLIALEEVVPAALPAYEKALAPEYRFHEVRGTVGIWSKHPLSDTRVVDIRPRGIEGAGAAVCAPWSTPRAAKSPPTWPTCRRSGWEPEASPRPGGTRAPICWAGPWPPRRSPR